MEDNNKETIVNNNRTKKWKFRAKKSGFPLVDALTAFVAIVIFMWALTFLNFSKWPIIVLEVLMLGIFIVFGKSVFMYVSLPYYLLGIEESGNELIINPGRSDAITISFNDITYVDVNVKSHGQEYNESRKAFGSIMIGVSGGTRYEVKNVFCATRVSKELIKYLKDAGVQI